MRVKIYLSSRKGKSKTHRKSTGFWRNAAEYAGYSLFKAVKR